MLFDKNAKRSELVLDISNVLRRCGISASPILIDHIEEIPEVEMSVKEFAKLNVTHLYVALRQNSGTVIDTTSSSLLSCMWSDNYKRLLAYMQETYPRWNVNVCSSCLLDMYAKPDYSVGTTVNAQSLDAFNERVECYKALEEALQVVYEKYACELREVLNSREYLKYKTITGRNNYLHSIGVKVHSGIVRDSVGVTSETELDAIIKHYTLDYWMSKYRSHSSIYVQKPETDIEHNRIYI